MQSLHMSVQILVALLNSSSFPQETGINICWITVHVAQTCFVDRREIYLHGAVYVTFPSQFPQSP